MLGRRCKKLSRHEGPSIRSLSNLAGNDKSSIPMLNKPRITLFLICLGLYLTTIGQFPTDIPGLQVWLDADSNLTFNGMNVTQWDDLSGNGNHAIQADPSLAPVYSAENAIINRNGVLSFDGVNDRLFIPNATTAGTVIIIANHNLTSLPPYSGLLTVSQGGLPSLLFVASDNGTSFLNDGRFGPNIFMNEIQTVNMSPIQKFKIIEGRAASTGTLDDLLIGSERLNDGRFWNGNVAEFMMFDHVLTEAESELIYGYLYSKFNPVMDLGADIEVNGFCPFQLGVADAFEDYMWSSGEQEAEITISSSGQYILTAQTVFGFIVSDTVNVSYPGNFIESFALCSGSDSLWDTGLDEGSFTFDWNSANSGSTILIDQEMEINLIVSDMGGCSYSPPSILVAEDTYPLTTTLGPDQDLCVGNTLELLVGAEEAEEILWNGTTIGEMITVDFTGDYTIQATNFNGCIAYDTIYVNILGEAPLAFFTVENTCFGQETILTDASTAIGASVIVDTSWDLGDLNADNGLEIFHTYAVADTFVIELTVTTDVGCIGKKSQEIIITPYPEAALDYEVPCDGQLTTFTDQSTVSQGEVVMFDWLFDNQAFASGEIAGYIFPDVGSYPVQLIVTTEGGCRDTTWQTVTVNGSPISAFNADWVCLGEPTLFQATPDVSASGPIQSYLWDFEGQSSIFQSTTYTWLNAGPHEVSLTVTSTLGCSDDTLMNVMVSLDPIGAFLDDANCFGQAIQFSDASVTSFEDQIVHWDWFFGSEGSSIQASPTFQFTAPGTYNVALNVVSAAGCEDQVDRLVTIHPLPQAEFSVFPEIGEPPFTPEITNLSNGANAYLWMLDFGQESEDFEPNHIFTDSGLVFIDLQVTNQYGCTDEATGSILLTELLTDLVLLDLDYSENADFINPILTVSNLSNYRVDSFTIHAEITNGTVLQEFYALPLEPGATRLIQMSSSLFYRKGADLPYICVNLSPEPGRADVDMSNNDLCKTIGTGTSDIFWLDPVPNPVQTQMTVGIANATKGPLLASVYDAIGRQVMEFEFSAGLSLVERYTINVSGIEPGRYVLRLVKGIHEKVYQFQVLKD